MAGNPTQRRRTKDSTFRLQLVREGVRAALVDAGLDPAEALSQSESELESKLWDAPDFIRDAGFLTVEERCKLYSAQECASAGLVETAKRKTVETFRQRRDNPENAANEPADLTACTIVTRVFRWHLDALQREEARSDEAALFADRERLIRETLNALGRKKAIQDATVEGRPAAELLEDDLRALSPRMLALVAGYATYSMGMRPAERWLEAATRSVV